MTTVQVAASESHPAALRVAVLAPDDHDGSAAAAAEVAHRLVRTRKVGPLEVRLLSRGGHAADPYGLRQSIEAAPTDVVVFVAPRRWGPRRLVAGPVMGGRVVAIVQADSPADLPAGSTTPDPAAPWVVAAMAKDVFLDTSAHWAGALTGSGRRVLDARADRARRDDLLAAIGAGPGLVLYAGHGRNRGWGGYQAIRWRHLEADGAARPAGLVIAFACDTLKRTRGRVPFGSRMVSADVAKCYLGAAGPIRTEDAKELSNLVVDLLATHRFPSAAHLVTAIDRAVVPRPTAARSWRQFRLLGDPMTPIDSPAG